MSEEAQEQQCTCNPEEYEFVTAECPVHPQMETRKVYDVKVTIIDDSMLADVQQPIKFLGVDSFLFVCPNCKEASIWNYHNGCPNCLTPIKIQSKKTTDFMRGKK